MSGGPNQFLGVVAYGRKWEMEKSGGTVLQLCHASTWGVWGEKRTVLICNLAGSTPLRGIRVETLFARIEKCKCVETLLLNHICPLSTCYTCDH